MRLTGTTHSIELITSAATSVDWHVAFNNITATDSTALDGQGKITTATTTSIVAAPAASEQRQVVNLIVSNNGTAANDITIQKNVGGTLYPLYKVTLAAGENLQFSPNMGFRVNDAQGRDKVVTADTPPITARTLYSNRISGTPAEAAGIRYWPNKDNGFPAAFVPGTPGLSGRAVVGTNAADAGCLPLWTPSGALWLRRLTFSSSIVSTCELIDLLLINSGIVVTTTTAQTLNTVTLPSRDANGATNGDGVMAGLLVTTATTNAGAFTNCTISYTNQAGTAGRTGTMGSFPATAVIGSVIPFELASGDTGIRSVESITLGTSMVAGAVSLILYRVIDVVAALNANNAQSSAMISMPYIRLWNGAALFPVTFSNGATTGASITAALVEER